MKKKFQEELTNTQHEIAEFKTKDHMAESKQHVAHLEEITQRLLDFQQQVNIYRNLFLVDNFNNV